MYKAYQQTEDIYQLKSYVKLVKKREKLIVGGRLNG